MALRDLDETIKYLPSPYPFFPRLEPPTYTGSMMDSRRRVGLAVESMKRHMTDEGWQIYEGLQCNGYMLAGHGLPEWNGTDITHIVNQLNPGTVLMQDKREWDVVGRDFREPQARFTNVELLRDRPDIFKLTILKDSHQRPDYHRQSADEIGCHAWVIYYHPRLVQHLAPYVRPEHLIRTYHSLDRLLVPPMKLGAVRQPALVSGAVSGAYPMRRNIIEYIRQGRLPGVHYLRHPGYHRNGCATPEFLQLLGRYKISICTSSVYGYALRKIVESTACGCKVITDLPTDEVMPHIDGNLVRVHPSIDAEELWAVVSKECETWDFGKQEAYALACRRWYDYKNVGARLAADIESMRQNWAMSSNLLN